MEKEWVFWLEISLSRRPAKNKLKLGNFSFKLYEMFKSNEHFAWKLKITLKYQK